jgi:hypothetical protein
MRKSVDLRQLLNEWPFDETANTRISRGNDGRQILQVRTPMGIEQYELAGRPDGLRPHDCASLLEYHQARWAAARTTGDETPLRLGADECAALFQEGTLFYFRYLHLFQLRMWEPVARDTRRNLGLFDFVRHHAEREEDQQHLEKWRPYVLRMNAIAHAMIAAEEERLDDALTLLRGAVQQIETLEPIEDETFQFEQGRSLDALRELLEQFRRIRPVPELERLELELRRAIESQAFERAAELRDRIRELRRPG